jgi:hypothetical protein
MPPAVVRLDRGEGGPLAGEALELLQGLERPIHARRAHFERVAPINRLVHVETIGDAPAEARAIRDANSARSIEQDPHDPPPTLNQELHVHELEPLLFRQRRRQLANLFAHFQIHNLHQR